MGIIDLATERCARPSNREKLERAARLRVSAARLVRMADQMKQKATDLERSVSGV